VICVFFGHTLPYVLRRLEVTDAGPNKYRLSGHCFVERIMDGKLAETCLAVKPLSDEKGKAASW
jgi:hypothetical protein